MLPMSARQECHARHLGHDSQILRTNQHVGAGVGEEPILRGVLNTDNVADKDETYVPANKEFISAKHVTCLAVKIGIHSKKNLH